MKRLLSISNIVVLYFIESIIYQLFFKDYRIDPNMKPDEMQSAAYWGCFYYIKEHLLVLLVSISIFKYLRNSNDIFAVYCLNTYTIGLLIYFSVLYLNPFNYPQFCASKPFAIGISVFLWAFGICIAIVKRIK